MGKHPFLSHSYSVHSVHSVVLISESRLKTARLSSPNAQGIKNLLIYHSSHLPLRLSAFARGNLYTPAPFTTAASLPIHSSWLRVFSRKDEKAQSFSESKNPDSFGKTVYRCFGASGREKGSVARTESFASLLLTHRNTEPRSGALAFIHQVSSLISAFSFCSPNRSTRR